MLPVSRATLYRAAARGAIPCFRVGRRVLFSREHLLRWLDGEEQDKLIAAARSAEEPAAFGIVFDLFTGIRIGELRGLRWENVQLDEQTFRVCETRNRLPNHDDDIDASTSVRTLPTTKTDNARRTVYLLGELYGKPKRRGMKR